jgi:hypothetical protein
MCQNVFKKWKNFIEKSLQETTENEIKELEPMKAYLGVAENHNIEHKNEKEKLKEFVRRLRLSLKTELSAKK